MLTLKDITNENKKYKDILRLIKELIEHYNMKITDILHLLNFNTELNYSTNKELNKKIIINLKNNIMYIEHDKYLCYLDEKIITLQKALFEKIVNHN